MTNKHILYGAEFSLYTGKIRSYLRYKRIPFDEVLSSLQVYKNIIVPNTGVRFVPVVKTPDGTFLQDTSHIIDTLETAFAERPVMPASPGQRLASLLLELYGDEWLLIPAMHYRWNHDNFPFIYEQFGGTLFPTYPKFLQRMLGKRIGARFAGFLPMLGITDHTHEAIEDWYENDFLVALNRHFGTHDFLLGAAPTIGDFGLMGPLYAHLSRDPYPGALMRRDAPNVAAWVERMNEGQDRDGELLPNDEVPATLTPIFRRLFDEHWPVLVDTAERLAQWAADNQDPAVPRKIGEQDFRIGKVTETRAVLPYSVWMMQRVLDCYHSMSDTDRQQADTFLEDVGAQDALQFQPPVRLTRIHNKLNLVSAGNGHNR
jgi:glutathione S-transferase